MSDEQNNTMGPIMVSLLKNKIFIFDFRSSGCYTGNPKNKVN